MKLAHQIKMRGTGNLAVGTCLYLMEDITRILLQLLDRIGIAGMHRHGDHRLYPRKIDIDTSIIVGDSLRREFPIGLRTAVKRKIVMDTIICHPYR